MGTTAVTEHTWPSIGDPQARAGEVSCAPIALTKWCVETAPIPSYRCTLGRKNSMKIIAYDNFKAGITLDDLKPFLREEVANVWRLWKAGIVRENYARADVGGVIIVFELDSVEEAKRYTDDFPLSKAGLIEWQFLAFDAPLPLEYLFDPTVDVAKPWDRTSAA
jgi:hypothetical protein